MNKHSQKAIRKSFIDKCHKTHKWFGEIGACTTAIQKRGLLVDKSEEMLGELVVSVNYFLDPN